MPFSRALTRAPCSLSGKERDQDGEGESSTSGVVSGGGEASGRRSASITALVPSPAPSAVPAARRSSFQSFPVGRRRSNRCRRSPSAALSPTLSLSKAQTRFTLSAMPASQARGLGVVPAVEMIAKPFSGCRAQLRQRDRVNGRFHKVDHRGLGDAADTESSGVLGRSGVMPLKRLPSLRWIVPFSPRRRRGLQRPCK